VRQKLNMSQLELVDWKSSVPPLSATTGMYVYVDIYINIYVYVYITNMYIPPGSSTGAQPGST
jgi:hypothetical protein